MEVVYLISMSTRSYEIAFDCETFHLNFLSGTPSWVLFEQDCNGLAGWFGHKSDEEIETMLSSYLESSASIQK